jgi:hypothetical protein
MLAGRSMFSAPTMRQGIHDVQAATPDSISRSIREQFAADSFVVDFDANDARCHPKRELELGAGVDDGIRHHLAREEERLLDVIVGRIPLTERLAHKSSGHPGGLWNRWK